MGLEFKLYEIKTKIVLQILPNNYIFNSIKDWVVFNFKFYTKYTRVACIMRLEFVKTPSSNVDLKFKFKHEFLFLNDMVFMIYFLILLKSILQE